MRAMNVDDLATAAKASLVQPEVRLASAVVTIVFEDGLCLLEDGRRARRACSCLVEPCAGDRVLVAGEAAGPGSCHVLHVLERRAGMTAHLSVPEASDLALRQRRLSLHAVDGLDLGCAGDVSLTAANGTLSLSGRNLFATVTDSIIEQAAHYVGRVGQFLLDAGGLLRLHGEQALITAEHDVKVDAERISMG